MVNVQVSHHYRGSSEEIQVALFLKGKIETKYEFGKLMETLKAIEPLIPLSTNPDE